MKKTDRPLSAAAALQRKLTRMAVQQGDKKVERSTEEAPAPLEAADAPSGEPKRQRAKARLARRPVEVEEMLREGRMVDATAAVLRSLAEGGAGSRHVQVKMPAWLHRDWSIFVAAQGREVREVLLVIILEKLAEALQEGLIP